MCDTKQNDDPEIMLYNMNYNRPLIERSLDITAKYVSDNKLILTGGTAIDMALRSLGEHIYEDDALPDYDIISEDNLRHATALAEILCKQGIKEINVITAIHITTLRVRIKNVTLLDATYLPKNLMEKVPYLDVGEFRVVHPNYQKIDQRLSLSSLMVNTGISLNIFNRLVKDINRNKILQELFEVNNSRTAGNVTKKVVIPKNLKIFTTRVTIPIKALEIQEKEFNSINEHCFIYTGDACCSGFLSYALFYNGFATTATKKELEGIIDPNVKINKTVIAFDLPTKMALSFLTCSNRIESTLNLMCTQIETKESTKKIKKFNALTTLKPITLQKVFKNYTIEASDTYGMRYSAVEFILNDKKIVSASIDYILMQFLRDRIFSETDEQRAIYSLYYESLLKMMNTKQEDYIKDNLKWFPSVSCYGFKNIPEYKAFAFEKIINPEDTKDYRPSSSYLRVPQCMTKSNFDPTKSHYFAIDGKENDSIVHTNLSWILDEIKLK